MMDRLKVTNLLTGTFLRCWCNLESFHLHGEMQILDAPRREVKKDAKNMTVLRTVHFHVQHCLYPSHCLNLPHLYQIKNHDSSENTSLSSSLSKMLEISSVLLLDAAIFIALDRRVYSVSNNWHGGQWLQRRRWLVVPHRGKTVDYLTALVPKSNLVIPRRY